MTLFAACRYCCRATPESFVPPLSVQRFPARAGVVRANKGGVCELMPGVESRAADGVNHDGAPALNPTAVTERRCRT